jgi:predicted phosphoribosyltransferase
MASANVRTHRMKIRSKEHIVPSDSLPELRREADDIVCLDEDHPIFGAIGFYYRDFRQVSDEEVIEILQRFPPRKVRFSRSFVR